MIVSKGTEKLITDGLVATIGFFDGVHLGHRFLIDELKKIAKDRGLPSAVITFSVHPRAVLQPGFHPNLLNTPAEKLVQLETTGLDRCIVLDFSHELASFSAQKFITTVLRERFNVKTLLIGYDHRFGRDRTDGFEQYVEYGKACGIEVVKASPFNAGEVTVSSSGIRDRLLKGEVEDATKLLSYPYSLTGHIVNGYKVGRKLGFPTANIAVDNPDKVIPAIGVYAVWVYVENEKHKGMLYIGDRPTLEDGNEITLEVNILNFNRDIYNNQITVAFITYVRGDIKFSSLEELKDQLAIDRDTVDKILDKRK
ncbi:bifunctional riboflavin kinase/FAD synthetase [Massilibacteroides sp.]|uniref:bifunctional riboflavin kinase/FAD synthetase n=1 Tax=Massilibacteroides sp. TaxID=2034766 RepID=UPI0026022DC6|nr:bifunctional riboflavin kinase/FAD synthetase [Massilibacteroides sp.]MDD4515899.1 bifunctional riboflavin kinase/FAD synthetase [Massilibacteroides sp.]